MIMSTTRLRTRATSVNAGVINSSGKVILGAFRSHNAPKTINGVPVDTGWKTTTDTPLTYVPDDPNLSYEATWDELHHHAPRKKGRRKHWRDIHPVNSRKGNPPSYLEGGPFLNIKVDNDIPATGVIDKGTYVNVAGTRRWEGGFRPIPNSSPYWGGIFSSMPSYVNTSNAFLPVLSQYFDWAWRRTKPKLELSDLFTFLAEAKEIFPMLRTTAGSFGLKWKNSRALVPMKTDFGTKYVERGAHLTRREMNPRELANQFLNYEFGWSPFLGDLESFMDTFLQAAEKLKKLTSQNGQWKRRRVKVIPKESKTTVISDYTFPFNSVSYALPCFPVSFPSDFFLSPPSIRVIETETMSLHASGKFRFYLPEFDSTLPSYTTVLNRIRQWQKLYGLKLNPYHIWKIIPWSWLVDWFLPVGSKIQRLTDFYEDSVAAAYFFVTCRFIKSRTIEIKLPLVTGHKTLRFTRAFASKQRVSADNPYGFGLTWDQLSPKRLSILSALGITRKR